MGGYYSEGEYVGENSYKGMIWDLRFLLIWFNIFVDFLDYLNGECFADNQAKRLLPFKVAINDKMTIELCKRLCFDGSTDNVDNSVPTGGFFYAGVRNSKECWCGNDKPKHDALAHHGLCGMPCSGDSTQKCGGSRAMNVYRDKGRGFYTKVMT